MGVIVDVREFTRSLERDERRVERALAGEVAVTARVATRVAESGANRGIYNTVPGRKYVRTGNYKALIRVTPLSAPNGFGLTIADDAPYASAIEYGRNSAGRTPGSPDLRSADLNDAGQAVGISGFDPSTPVPPYYGRTGLTYRAPQPVLTAAGLVALWRLRRKFEQTIEQL